MMMRRQFEDDTYAARMGLRTRACALALGLWGAGAAAAACASSATGGPGVNVIDGGATPDANNTRDAGPNVTDAAQIEDARVDAPAADASADASVIRASCKDVLAANPGAADGVRTIDVDGPGPQPAIPVFCDMTRDGGGWTLALLVNSLHNSTYPTFGSGYVSPAALAADPKTASQVTPAPPALGGWLDLNTVPYTQLVLEGYAAGASTFRSNPIAKSTLRIPFGQPGYYLYDDANGYFWCGGNTNYTDNGVGQVNQPANAPADCKGHTSLGDGWDFGMAGPNSNLTMCGGGSRVVKAGTNEGFVAQATPGAAHAFWIR